MGGIDIVCKCIRNTFGAFNRHSFFCLEGFGFLYNSSHQVVSLVEVIRFKYGSSFKVVAKLRTLFRTNSFEIFN